MNPATALVPIARPTTAPFWSCGQANYKRFDVPGVLSTITLTWVRFNVALDPKGEGVCAARTYAAARRCRLAAKIAIQALRHRTSECKHDPAQNPLILIRVQAGGIRPRRFQAAVFPGSPFPPLCIDQQYTAVDRVVVRPVLSVKRRRVIRGWALDKTWFNKHPFFGSAAPPDSPCHICPPSATQRFGTGTEAASGVPLEGPNSPPKDPRAVEGLHRRLAWALKPPLGMCHEGEHVSRKMSLFERRFLVPRSVYAPWGHMCQIQTVLWWYMQLVMNAQALVQFKVQQ